MGLFSRNSTATAEADPQGPAGAPAAASEAEAAGGDGVALTPERHGYLNQLKAGIHQQLVQKLDVQSMHNMPADRVHDEVRILVRDLCQSERGLLTAQEQTRLIEEVMDETFGHGPIETLLKDPTIADILVNRHDCIYVERKGRMERVDVQFRDSAHLRQIIDRIVARIGRRIDESSPMVDARLPDGSRVNAIIPPLALDGPAMSIRRFGARPLRLEDLIALGSVPKPVLDFLGAAVKAKCNVLISGGTGSGKTTLLNCLSRFISHEERIITIEDAAELQLQQPHVVRLETRPPNMEGKGEVTQRDLVRNCLRMRPDRIVIGEVRGGEALDMLQAMNTGHEGSMTTVHANSPRDALYRLEVMVTMAGFDIPVRATRQQIASALQLVIQQQRLTGGRRKIVSVSEITGMEGERVQMHDLFTFEQQGVDENGHAIGQFIATGIRPHYMDQIHAAGVKVDPDLFVRHVIQ